MIHFITYGSGGPNYERAKQRILKEAAQFGVFDRITGHGMDTLSPEFREKYKDVLSMRRGGGYWIWKFDIIQQELSKINEGDFIVYADAGCTINASENAIKRFYDCLKILSDSPYGILNYSINAQEYIWTTQQIFEHFNVDSKSMVATSNQRIATIFIVQKNAHSEKWLSTIMDTLAHDRFLFTDKYNNNQPNPCFRDNRHDQSVASVVSKLQGSIVIPWNQELARSPNVPFWDTRYR